MGRPVITVLGATGSQGGAVVDALLEQNKFAVRAVTRNAAKAQKLADKGVQIVEANMSDKAALVKAFTGSEGVFIVTDFYGNGCKAETEVEQGKNAVDAAKEAGVRYVVYSALEDPRTLVPKGSLPELSHEPGRLVSHFESKAAVLEYLKASGVPYTALLTSLFYDNWITFFQYQRQPDGTRVFSDNLGTKPIAVHSCVDIGGSAAVAFADPEKCAGKVVPVVRERLAFPRAAEILTEVTGVPVKYVPISDEQFSSLPFPAAEDLMAMFRYYREHETYNDLRNPANAIFHGPDFREWATKNRDALVAALNK